MLIRATEGEIDCEDLGVLSTESVLEWLEFEIKLNTEKKLFDKIIEKCSGWDTRAIIGSSEPKPLDKWIPVNALKKLLKK